MSGGEFDHDEGELRRALALRARPQWRRDKKKRARSSWLSSADLNRLCVLVGRPSTTELSTALPPGRHAERNETGQRSRPYVAPFPSGEMSSWKTGGAPFDVKLW